MSTETEIRTALVATCQERGKTSEIARLLDVHPTTVKRWVDGGEIPAVMLKVLAWVLFGEAPERLRTPLDLQTTLEFEEDEWKAIEAMARREGTTPARFIAGRVRAYLAYRETFTPGQRLSETSLRVAEPPADYGKTRNGGE